MKKEFLDIRDEGIPTFLIREITILRELKDPQVINLKDIIIDKKKCINLVFEYIE